MCGQQYGKSFNWYSHLQRFPSKRIAEPIRVTVGYVG